MSINDEKIKELRIKYDKYLEIKHEKLGFIKINKIENFYETESFILILFELDTIKTSILIKKDELGNLKNKLIDITNLQIEEKRTEEQKNKFSFITQNIPNLIVLFLYLGLMILLFNLYPISKIKDSQVYVSQQKFIYAPQNSQYSKMGLKLYDIPLEIDGINTKYISQKKLEEMLKGKNVRLKVFKRETREYVEYKLNTD